MPLTIRAWAPYSFIRLEQNGVGRSDGVLLGIQHEDYFQESYGKVKSQDKRINS
jgi:hypothetical protein